MLRTLCQTPAPKEFPGEDQAFTDISSLLATGSLPLPAFRVVWSFEALISLS